MIENPYYAAPSGIPTDADLYRGEGCIEESHDGSSFAIWYESTLEDGVAAQMHFQQKLGTMKNSRRFTLICLFFALVCFLYAALIRSSSEGFSLFVMLFGFFIGTWACFIRCGFVGPFVGSPFD
jgi:hypothetical protein